MSDARLRELERRWRERGALDDEVALLRARVRAGALTELRLELAARCGHPAAVAALDGRVAPVDLDLVRVRRVWADDLKRHDKALTVRAVLALARRGGGAVGPRAADALEAAAAWLACPCEDHRLDAGAAERPCFEEAARAQAPQARRGWLAARAAAAAGALDAFAASRALVDVSWSDLARDEVEALRAALIAAALEP